MTTLFTQEINKMPVELYFIRHAHSCANMIESYGAKGWQVIYKTDYRPIYANNPHITNFGISHALGSTFSEKENYTKQIQPDIICASQLIRTWETAYTLFFDYFNQNKNQVQNNINNINKNLKQCDIPLYICPYIGEKRGTILYTDLDNQPENIKISNEKFIRFLKHFRKYINDYYNKNETKICKPKIVYLERNNGYSLSVLKKQKKQKIENYINQNSSVFYNLCLTNEPNFDNFKNKILESLILFAVSSRNKKNGKLEKKIPINKENPLRIVLVTHSKFMEENIVKHLSTKNEILKFRNNGNGGIKVFNCDVYKIEVPPKINSYMTRTLNPPKLFFPKILNHENYDNYVMPPIRYNSTGKIINKKFNIGDKNTIKRYLELYSTNLNYFDLNIILGLCNKENKQSQKEFRKFILNVNKELKNIENMKRLKELKNIENKKQLKELKNKLNRNTQMHENKTNNGQEMKNLTQRNANLDNLTLGNRNFLNKNYLSLINQRNEYGPRNV